MNDRELIESCKEGNMNAFNALYDKYCSQALRTAYLITDNKELAEDVVQETFIKCYMHISRLKDPQAFKAWFYKILTNLCYRMKAKERDNVSIEEMSDKGIQLLQHSLGLDNSMEAKEIQLMVHEAISQLKPSLKTIVILYYFNDLSIKEIAKAVGCFEGTVKSRLHSARKILMKQIEHNQIVKVHFSEINNEKEVDFNAKASLF